MLRINNSTLKAQAKDVTLVMIDIDGKPASAYERFL